MNTHFKIFASYNILQYICDFIHVLIFVTVSKRRKSPKLTNIVIYPPRIGCGAISVCLRPAIGEMRPMQSYIPNLHFINQFLVLLECIVKEVVFFCICSCRHPRDCPYCNTSVFFYGREGIVKERRGTHSFGPQKKRTQSTRLPLLAFYLILATWLLDFFYFYFFLYKLVHKIMLEMV